MVGCMAKISISPFCQSCTNTVGISPFQKEGYLWESYLCFTCCPCATGHLIRGCVTVTISFPSLSSPPASLGHRWD